MGGRKQKKVSQGVSQGKSPPPEEEQVTSKHAATGEEEKEDFSGDESSVNDIEDQEDFYYPSNQGGSGCTEQHPCCEGEEESQDSRTSEKSCSTNHTSQKAKQQSQQQNQKKINELNSLLIHIYNGKPTKDYIQQFRNVYQIYKEEGKEGCQIYRELEERISTIMQQVNQKLVTDGKSQNLIREIPRQDKSKDYQISSPFEDETARKNYMSVIQGVVEFFDLFLNNADKVEHIFYEMFKHIGIQTHQTRTFFNAVHYRIYSQKVIDSPGVKQMIQEVRPFTDHSEDIKQHFLKIDQIKAMGEEAVKPNNDLCRDFDTFYREIAEESKVDIIGELLAFSHQPIQLEDNFVDEDQENSGRKKGKKKQKRPENFQQHSTQYKKAARDEENNKFQQMDIDSLINAIEQDSGKQAGKKKGKKKAQRVNPEQVQEAPEPSQSVSTGDPEDSEEFESALCSFQSRLQQQQAKAKIKPNVSKVWLEGLRKQLQTS